MSLYSQTKRKSQCAESICIVQGCQDNYMSLAKACYGEKHNDTQGGHWQIPAKGGTISYYVFVKPNKFK